MNEIQLPYHRDKIPCPELIKNGATIFLPPSPTPLPEPSESLQSLLLNYLKNLQTFATLAGKEIGVAINDHTRPLPYQILLPVVIKILSEFGAGLDKIKLFIATGTHKPLDLREELCGLSLPDLGIIQIHLHDCDRNSDLIFLGSTSRGTEVWINHQFYQSDFKIVLGNIEPHHFMGYSGGAKTAAIGLSGRKTIEQNHSMLGLAHTTAGCYEDNPMRQDVEEIGDFINIDLAINTIQTPEHQIIDYLIGRPREIMGQGVKLCQRYMQVPINGVFDLVIASAGGYPKDINLYQSQKAITHGSLFCKPGGVVILCAACSSGIGSTTLETFMRDIVSPQQAIDQFLVRDFRIGPHKAYQLALQVQRNPIILVSMLNPDLVKKYFMTPAETLEAAIDSAKSLLCENPRVAILPFASHTIPIHHP